MRLHRLGSGGAVSGIIVSVIMVWLVMSVHEKAPPVKEGLEKLFSENKDD